MSYLYFRFPTLQTKVLITICADVNYLYKNCSMIAQIQKSVCVPILPTCDHLLALWCFHSACVKLFVVVHNCNTGCTIPPQFDTVLVHGKDTDPKSMHGTNGKCDLYLNGPGP